MNDQERKEFYAATCRCCLLAQAMKTCPACRFRIGLAEQARRAAPFPPSQAQAAVLAMPGRGYFKRQDTLVKPQIQWR